MRAFITALSLAFVLGTLATTARAECAYGHAKQNDFETPPPAAAAKKPKQS